MAQNFFFRRPTIAGTRLSNYGNHLDGIGAVRVDGNNPFGNNDVSEAEIGNYSFTMAINGTTAVTSGGTQGFQFSNFNSTLIAYLMGATVTMEGDYGSLMRFEVNCKISSNKFDDFDKTFLAIGNNVTISFSGHGTGGLDDESRSYQAKLYDFSWTINPDGTVDINMKAVGQGHAGLYVNLYDGATVAYQGLQYRADYDDDGGANSLTGVTSIVDYFDHRIQSDTGLMTSVDFNPAECCNVGYWMIRYNINRGNKLFVSEYSIDQDLWMEQARGIYVTLGWIIDTLNMQFGYGTSKATINFKAQANLMFDKIGYMPSANPIECIFSDGGNPGAISSVQPVLYGKDAAGCYPNSVNGQGYDAMGVNRGSFDIHSISGRGLKDILINRDLLRGILKEATSIKQSGNVIKFAGIELSIPEYFLSVETFFSKLFSVIKANSGGAIDLIVLPDIDDPGTALAPRLSIYNLRGPENFYEPFVFTKGSIGIRDVKMISKVPSATAAAAFGARGASGDSESEKAGNTIALPSAGTAVDKVGEGYPGAAEVLEAMHTAQYADFAQAEVDGLRGVLKRMVDNDSPEETVTKTTLAWPIELKLTIVGIDGWRFGDTISYSALPDRYRDDRGKIKIGFTITRVVHTFGTEWTTDITSQCRFVGGGSGGGRSGGGVSGGSYPASNVFTQGVPGFNNSGNVSRGTGASFRIP
jgi:hypothetical protein